MASSSPSTVLALAVGIVALHLAACTPTDPVVRAELKVNRQTGYFLNGKAVPRTEIEQQLRQLANGRQLEVAIVADWDATHEQVIGALDAAGRVAAKVKLATASGAQK